jgi:hypothetical protein
MRPSHLVAARAIDLSGAVPIVVGVTGHRDLLDDERPRIEADVRRILVSYLETHAETPVVLVSALAEGSDRLAADVALSLRDSPGPGQGRVRLLALLPMPRDAYAEDFSEPGSLERMDALLARADASWVLPPAPGVAVAALRESLAAREEQYALLAAWLARSCHVLLAIWNGKESPAKGGTACVVDWFEGHVPTALHPDGSPLDAEDALVLQHVMARRRKDPEEGPRRAGATPKETAEEVLSQLGELDADLRRHGPSLAGPMAESRASLLPEDLGPLAGDVAPIVASYAAADALSFRVFQRGARSTARWIVALAILGLAAWEVFAHGIVARAWVLLLYLLCFGGAVLFLGRARRLRVEDKYLVYRSFAEALRVQLAWHVAGIRASVADHYERIHRHEVEWVRQALVGVRATVPLDERLEGDGEEALARLHWVRRHWVNSQARWFEARVPRLEERHHRAHVLSRTLLWAGTAVLVFLLGASFAHDGGALEHGAFHALHTYLGVGAVLLLALAGLVHGYDRKQATFAQAERYRTMARLYARAAERLRAALASPPRVEEARRVEHRLAPAPPGPPAGGPPALRDCQPCRGREPEEERHGEPAPR